VGLLEAILLGAVQGLTEFLPVSSSAHLILVRLIFGWDADRLGMAFDVACHVGTFIAVVAYYWRDLLEMAAALPRLFHRDADGAARLMQLIAIGTLPVVAVGLTVAGVEEKLRTPAVAATTLALGALVFFWVERVGKQRRDVASLSFGEAAGIGVAEALALVPGVSRSGATISCGLWLGLSRASAARFSFLLGIPAIMAAAGHEGLHLAKAGLSAADAQVFGVGMATSAIVGYLGITVFLKYIANHSLSAFAWYRLVAAALVVAWWMAGRG